MFYLSDHLRSLYESHTSTDQPAPFEICHVGVDESTFAAAQQLNQIERDPHRIVSVSAMARWKGAETLIAALSKLRDRACPAALRLVGPWPDATYRQRIESLIHRFNLEQQVEIVGKVSQQQLYHEYAQARVFCLLSHCESFGIPAVEAQAFGTPGVVSTGCAMPEVCGEGAVAVPPSHADAAADALEKLITSDDEWFRYSQSALANVDHFRWEKTAAPLMRMFDSQAAVVLSRPQPTLQEEQVVSGHALRLIRRLLTLPVTSDGSPSPAQERFSATDCVDTKDQNLQTTVIEPQRGWIALDIAELWRYRDLFTLLIWRDVAARYRQSVVGIGWAVIKPGDINGHFHIHILTCGRDSVRRFSLSIVYVRRLDAMDVFLLSTLLCNGKCCQQRIIAQEGLLSPIDFTTCWCCHRVGRVADSVRCPVAPDGLVSIRTRVADRCLAAVCAHCCCHGAGGRVVVNGTQRQVSGHRASHSLFHSGLDVAEPDRVSECEGA